MTFLLPPVMRRHSAGVYSVLGLAVLASVLAWHCQRLPLHFLLYYLAPVLVWARLILYLITRSFTGLAMSRLGALVILQVVAILLIIRESFFDRRWLSLGFLTLLTHPIINSQIVSRHARVTDNAPLHDPLLPRGCEITRAIPRSSFPHWLLSLAALSVFPWLPVVDGRMEHSAIVLGSGQWL